MHIIIKLTFDLPHDFEKIFIIFSPKDGKQSVIWNGDAKKLLDNYRQKHSLAGFSF